jgi:hypothetical protein
MYNIKDDFDILNELLFEIIKKTSFIYLNSFLKQNKIGLTNNQRLRLNVVINNN